MDRCGSNDPCLSDHQLTICSAANPIGFNSRTVLQNDPAEVTAIIRVELKSFREALLKEVRESFLKQTEVISRLSRSPYSMPNPAMVSKTIDSSEVSTSWCGSVCTKTPIEVKEPKIYGKGFVEAQHGASSQQPQRAPIFTELPMFQTASRKSLEGGVSLQSGIGGGDSLATPKSQGPPATPTAGSAETNGATASNLQCPSKQAVAGEDDSEEEDGSGPQLKIDGAFGAIFAKDDSDVAIPHFSVEHYYYETGMAQSMARSELFINVGLFVISMNAIYLGVDSDYNKADDLFAADWFFIIGENAFCCFFTIELLVRFLAFEKKQDCSKDGWFRFDALLVLLMIAETWILAPALHFFANGNVKLPVEPMRLMRLLRLTRMARLMRSLPEIVTMTKGMMMASRAVASALLMSAALIYTHAIVLTMLLSKEADFNAMLHEELGRDISSIPMCMWTLLLDGTFMMDGAGVIMTAMLNQGEIATVLACVIFLVFMLLSALTVMNMLIGVLCQVVSAVAEGETTDAAIRLMKESILMDLKKFDDGDGLISHSELMQVMVDPQSRRVLKSLNVDRLFLMELQRMLFPTPQSQVNIKTIMELMLMCRGDLPATVKSLSSGLSYVVSMMHHFEFRLVDNMGLIRRQITEFRNEMENVNLLMPPEKTL